MRSIRLTELLHFFELTEQWVNMEMLLFYRSFSAVLGGREN
jgi:hypothetical protein